MLHYSSVKAKDSENAEWLKGVPGQTHGDFGS